MSLARVLVTVGVWGAFALGTTLSAQTMDEQDMEMQETAPPVRLMSSARDRTLRTLLPRVEDDEVQSILKDPRLILYTDREMPKTYQFWTGSLAGLHRPEYNISANGSEPFGNGNVEFPWGDPAGTHLSKNVDSLRFLWLPRGDHGATLPVVWYRDSEPGESRSGYAWLYPRGTIFGEVLTLRGPDRRDYTFELRLRKRERDDWAVDVFRPFPTADDLAQRIREVRPDGYRSKSVEALVAHLEGPVELEQRRLRNRHPRKLFDETMGVDVLPDAGDDDLVMELLTSTPFRSALGQVWRKGTNDAWTCAPTTEADFHVVPADYTAGYIEVNRVSCARCHDTTNQNVSRFEFGRDWYGRIRGSDGIFSFHPFEPSAVSGNGMGGSARMRGKFVRTGVLERYDRSEHPARLYHKLSRRSR